MISLAVLLAGVAKTESTSLGGLCTAKEAIRLTFVCSRFRMVPATKSKKPGRCNMKRAIQSLMCSLWVVVAFGQANAGLIYDNGVSNIDIDWVLLSYTGTGTGHQWQTADDFGLGAGPWRVDGATWSGTYLNDGDFLPTVGLTFDFNIMIFADNGGQPTGRPIDPIPGTAIAHRTATATGVDTGFGDIIADFSVSFDPIFLDGETDYWFVVAATGDFTFMWPDLEIGDAWLISSVQTGGNAAHGGTNFDNDWVTLTNQMDFGLFGAQIPEPDYALLLMLVCIGLVGFRQRRARVPLMIPSRVVCFVAAITHLATTKQNESGIRGAICRNCGAVGTASRKFREGT